MMPAGRYYIGDLCYVMPDEWDEFCNITIPGNEVLDGEFALKDGRKFATYGTAHGDGEYACSNGAFLGVDAGLIGCIKIADISDAAGIANMDEYGAVVDFPEDFHTGEQDGVIVFGHIHIDTNWDE